MNTIIQHIPMAISAILTAALILTVVTNIIVQVLKGLTYDKIPTNFLAVGISMVVTLVAFFAVCAIAKIAGGFVNHFHIQYPPYSSSAT